MADVEEAHVQMTPATTYFRCVTRCFPSLVSGGLCALCVLALARPDFGSDSDTLSLFDIASDTYEVVVLLASFAAMILLTRLLKTTNHLADDVTDGYGVFRLTSRLSKISYRIFMLILCALSLVTLVFKLESVAVCLGQYVKWTDILRFCLFLCRIIFCVSLYVFTNFARDKRCDSKTSTLLVSVVVSASLCLCVRCLTDAAHHTMLNAIDSDVVKTFYLTFCIVSNRNWSYAYDITDRYFYTFIFTFCLYSMGCLNRVCKTSVDPVHIANGNENSTFSESDRSQRNISSTQSNDRQRLTQPPQTRTLCDNIKNICMKIIMFLCNYSVLLTALPCTILLATNTYQNANHGDFKVFINATELKSDPAYSWIQTIYGYVISIVAFIGFLLVRMKHFNRSDIHYKHLLFVITAVGFHFELQIFEIIDAVANVIEYHKASRVILFLLKILLYIPGLYWQTMLVLKSSNLDLHRPSSGSNKLLYLYGILVFIGVCNLERAIVDIVLTPATLKYAREIPGDFLSAKAWRVITRVFYPGVIFYRIHTALLCFEKTGVKLRRSVDN